MYVEGIGSLITFRAAMVNFLLNEEGKLFPQSLIPVHRYFLLILYQEEKK